MAKLHLITDGTQMDGVAMPHLMKSFQEAVVGRRITAAGYISLQGDAYPVLVLDNGESIVIHRDERGGGPGVPETSSGHKLPSSRRLAT